MSTATRTAVTARIDDLVTRAKSETGLEDLGRDSWREGLEVLVASALGEAGLTEQGEEAFYTSIVRHLSTRLQVEDWYRRHPEIDEQEVHLQLLGVGFPRTGSTALSYMLGQDDAYRNLLTWEEANPCPPPGLDPAADQARIAAAEAMVEMTQTFIAPRLRSLVPSSATGPIEDHDIMALEFTAQIFLVTAKLPSYAEWFLDCDMERTYEYEKRVLKLLQWKTPQKLWRLKSPTHTLFLEAYEKVFPDARFVQTHRDVSAVLPSVSDLYLMMLQMGTPSIDPVWVGELNTAQWSTSLDRVLQFRTDPARDAKFFDIGFATFQADPISEIRRLYDWLGDDLRDSVVEKMLAWRADNPKDKHGKHTYDAETFGLTEDLFRTRFAAYREQFGPLL